MKTKKSSIKIIFSLLCVLAFSYSSNAQILKKLGKRAEKAAERTVERRVEKETTKKTDKILDSILEPGKKGKNPTDKDGNPIPRSENPNDSSKNPKGTSESDAGKENNATSDSKALKVYSKYDFVPGDKLLFFENFADDFIGDFPAKWNTNGSGEIVTIGDSSEKWLELKPGYNLLYIPDVPELPEEYTIEFETRIDGIDNKTSSTAGLEIILSDDDQFSAGANHVTAWLPFGQYGVFNIRMKNFINRGGGGINSAIKADIRQAVLERPHFAIAVNKQRFRLWVNEKKYVDIPRIMPTEKKVTTLKFQLNNFKDEKERLFITNLKVAEGGLDLRRTLLAKGRVSTNGILFESGSANLRPQSMGIIRQIYQVLQQETSMSLKIVGHTDADGEDSANMELSKKRAEAVKQTLISEYNIAGDRLQTEGKGESEPVSDNTTSDGKAKNRRVEFIQQ